MKHRVVIKIGSSSLANRRGGIATERLINYSKAISQLVKEGHEPILISSGAVAAGFHRVGYATRPVTTVKKQAAAAVGQGLLMEAYQHAFMQEDVRVAQLLLTRESFQHEHQYNNAYATLQELLKRRIVPVINENDSIAIEELTFGDNDWLASLVAGLIHADTLILLTDVNGVYDRNPQRYANAKQFSAINEITEELLEASGKSKSSLGTGGMRSKLEAAKNAQTFSIRTFIGKGDDYKDLQAIIEGSGDGTYVNAFQGKTWPKEKQWVGIYSPVEGDITIDDGAKVALLHGGKSLLSVGVSAVHGDFLPDAVIAVYDQEGQQLGKGRAALSSTEMHGHRNDPSGHGVVCIHRDHWVSYQKGRVFHE